MPQHRWFKFCRRLRSRSPEHFSGFARSDAKSPAKAEIIGMILTLPLIGASIALARENTPENGPIIMGGAKPTYLIAAGLAILVLAETMNPEPK
ncbi:hypothetical protein JDN40_01770 [Rhodomicrobium vannielii ATCC 17100]|uniref:hypothetical protein n=1 Tax=Rhodomicrobium vannielii TaxID=1069 RepID=UPI00191AE664|nr:hypothetical protein [Rhodomicrobium vannielii]MBJ7532845.1 hypothetical protein [Rhodomicrobium vannielii ATCC 17100]